MTRMYRKYVLHCNGIDPFVRKWAIIGDPFHVTTFFRICAGPKFRNFVSEIIYFWSWTSYLLDTLMPLITARPYNVSILWHGRMSRTGMFITVKQPPQTVLQIHLLAQYISIFGQFLEGSDFFHHDGKEMKMPRKNLSISYYWLVQCSEILFAAIFKQIR